jgi:hypothetical protein
MWYVAMSWCKCSNECALARELPVHQAEGCCCLHVVRISQSRRSMCDGVCLLGSCEAAPTLISAQQVPQWLARSPSATAAAAGAAAALLLLLLLLLLRW